MTPPPLLRCLPASGSELDVTPPPPPRQPPRRISSSPVQLSSSPPLQSFSPPLLSSSPPLVHSSPEKPATSPVVITTRVIRHDSNQAPPPATVVEASSDKEELNSSCSSSQESWGSLPQQREENESRKAVPETVGSRVEQLTKMVENLTAKFVLLENHLKLAQVQAERHGSADDGETGNAVEREKERGERERKLPLKDITREMMLKQAHVSSPMNERRSDSPMKQHQSSSTPPKQPLLMKQVNKSTSEAAFSQREATPLSSVSTPEPSSERMPLSSLREGYIHQRYTSHHSLKLDFATPSTPVGIQNSHIITRTKATEGQLVEIANKREKKCSDFM